MVLPKQLEEFRFRKIWVCYVKVQLSNGRTTKPPVDAFTLRNAGSTNSKTWATFDEAVAQIGKTATIYLASEEREIKETVAGVGINLETTELLGIDIDHAIERSEDGRIIRVLSDAKKLWTRVNSYTEFSPSGTGVHILVKAKNTNPDLNRNGLPKGLKDIVPGFELYDNGRYFTVTGNALTGCPGIQERQEVINEIIKEWRQIRDESRASSSVVSCGGNGNRIETSASDMELWVKMLTQRNADVGVAIRKLYNGDLTDFDGDHSRADQALCNHLAYWTNCDPKRMDDMFRESGLMRDKWNRDDYRNATIAKAIAGRPVYREYTPEEKRAYAKMKEAEEKRRSYGG